MKTFFTLAALLLIFIETKAQQTFQKVIHFDSISSLSTPYIKPTQDGGFIYSSSHVRLLPHNNAIAETSLGKFDKMGELQWMQLLGGGYDPVPLQLEDSSYILSGTGGDIQLIKTDKAGNMLWGKFYTHNGEREASVIRASNGFVYILYNSYSGVGIVKINAQTGATVMDKLYAKGALESGWEGTCIYETSDKGFIICGFGSNSTDPSLNIYLLKTDSLLNQQWSKIFYKKHTDSIYKTTTVYSVLESLDKGYVTVGWSRRRGNSNDQKADILKVDNKGNLAWHKQYSSDSSNYIWDITKNADSTFTAVGYSGSCGFPCRYRGTMTKIGPDGKVIWSRVTMLTNLLLSVIKSTSKTFTAVGFANVSPGGTHIVRFTNDGQSCAGIKNNKFIANNVFDSVVSNSFIVSIAYKKIPISFDPGTNTLVTPNIFTNCTTSVRKEVIENSIVNIANDFNAVLYPNPVQGKSALIKINSSWSQKMKLMVLNTEGKIISQRDVLINAGNNNVQLNISMLNGGAYFIKLETKRDRKIIQFIKIK